MPIYYIVPRLIVVEEENSLKTDVWCSGTEKYTQSEKERGKHRREAIYGVRTEAQFRPERFRTILMDDEETKYRILWPEEVP